jgi:hypothetical protein
MNNLREQIAQAFHEATQDNLVEFTSFETGYEAGWQARATPADHIAVSGKEIWEYSFVHSSALDRRDEKVTMLTYEKADAFRPECSDQKLVCSVGMFVAEVSQDREGFKHIADVVELDDIPAGTRLYAIAAGNVAAPQPEAQSVPVSERLIAAIEGECDGLAITGEQASNILAYLQYGAQMDDVLKDAERYRKLRNADIDSVSKGGVFAGLTPDNVVINGEDLDIAVDLLINGKEKS